MPQWIRAPECCLSILSLHFSLHSSASFMQYVRFTGKAVVQESQAREVQPSATASDPKLYLHSLHIKKKHNYFSLSIGPVTIPLSFLRVQASVCQLCEV